MYKSSWSICKQELELAVKNLKAGSSEEDKVKFHQCHQDVWSSYYGEPVSEFT